MRPSRVISLTVALAVVVGACGGSADPGDTNVATTTTGGGPSTTSVPRTSGAPEAGGEFYGASGGGIIVWGAKEDIFEVAPTGICAVLDDQYVVQITSASPGTVGVIFQYIQKTEIQESLLALTITVDGRPVAVVSVSPDQSGDAGGSLEDVSRDGNRIRVVGTILDFELNQTVPLHMEASCEP